MGGESDRIHRHVGCLDTTGILATLVSTTGYHCDVWRSIGAVVRGESRIRLDIVIKVYRGGCSVAEAVVYCRHYRTLKAALGDIVPDAVFVATRIDDIASVIVIARAVTPWFNLANPANESEAVPLVRQSPRIRAQLARFVAACSHWRSEGRVIDLYGLDNLVVDQTDSLRYVDSFEVFFFLDMLTLLEQSDDVLRRRIELSLARLDYLDYMLKASGGVIE